MFVNYLNYVLVKLFFLKLSLYLYLLCFSFVSIYHFWWIDFQNMINFHDQWKAWNCDEMHKEDRLQDSTSVILSSENTSVAVMVVAVIVEPRYYYNLYSSGSSSIRPIGLVHT